MFQRDPVLSCRVRSVSPIFPSGSCGIWWPESLNWAFIEKLYLHNYEPQQINDLQWILIEYRYLTTLDLISTHQNYVEQFLNNTKTYLVKNFYLRACYKSLQKATHDFTRDETRVNCAKIIGLLLYKKGKLQKLKDYSPNAEIY
jgi:hypothetical protein